MAQVREVILPDGQKVVPADWTSAEPLWSTIEVSAGQFPLLRAFSYSAGADVPGSIGPRIATDCDTNLQGQGSVLPENEELICYNLAIEVFKLGTALSTDYFPDADNPEVPLPDMLRMQRDLVITFKIAAIKEYTHATMGYFPAGTGVAYAMSGGLTKISSGQTGVAVANNGSPSPADVRVFSSPLYVAGGESFSIDVSAGPGEVVGLNLAPDTAEAPQSPGRMRMRMFLDGLRRRPVA